VAQRKHPAIAYLRTSSAANVGAHKDSGKRQREAIAAFAKREGFELVAEFYDAAVSGADPIQDRPGFSELLDKIESNGVSTVIVEDQSRFARDMQAHVLGLALLRERGVRLLASNGSDLTDETDEITEAMIHIAAVFAALEKKRLVKKLRHARERKRERDGKCEGRKSHSEGNPDAVKLAKRLHRASPRAFDTAHELGGALDENSMHRVGFTPQQLGSPRAHYLNCLLFIHPHRPLLHCC
jgi:DNA invertase Pin-like site-specific DNA recombinase